MLNKMKIIREREYRTTQWSGGKTREIMILPESAELSKRNFDVRISSAIISECKSCFSDFSGYMRYILPVQGDITLSIDNQQKALYKNEALLFDGGQHVTSVNTLGTIDFNVIFKKHLDINVFVVKDETNNTDEETTSIIFALTDMVVNEIHLSKYDTIVIKGKYEIRGSAIVVNGGGIMF